MRQHYIVVKDDQGRAYLSYSTNTCQYYWSIWSGGAYDFPNQEEAQYQAQEHGGKVMLRTITDIEV